MRFRAVSVLLGSLATAVLLAACEVRFPDGTFTCKVASDCPGSELKACLPSADNPEVKLCFRRADGGASGARAGSGGGGRAGEGGRGGAGVGGVGGAAGEPADAGRDAGHDGGAAGEPAGAEAPPPVAPSGGSVAAQGGSGGGGGGAGDAGCPDIDPGQVSVTTLRDDVVQVPAELGDLLPQSAVSVGDRLLWFVGAAPGALLANRTLAAWVEVAALRSGSPSLTASSDTLLTDEPAPGVLATSTTAAWQSQSGAIGFYYVRFRDVSESNTSVGYAQTTIAMLTPAQVVVAPDKLFPAQPAADGGVAPFHPQLISGALLEGGFIYAYDCHPRPVMEETDVFGAHYQPCRALRVAEAQVADASAYEYWNGADWGKDYTDTPIAIERVPGGGLTVRYNPFLKRYLAVHTLAGNKIRLAWAAAPQGPFQVLADLPTVEGSGGGTYIWSASASELPVPQLACDATVFATYGVPRGVADAGTTPRYETHVMTLQLERK